ncbi:MAG: NAD-dependent epimerase/dehydratase family protein [Myxococcales bacterium]|nr:NAD-dependent epimerase/dehydratase family protein [Myxococcales bacterium]
MRVLVTGAAGYVGRHLCDRLRRAGMDVTGLVRRSAPGLTVPVRYADLSDVDAIPRALDGIDVVIHSAARVGAGTAAAFERDNVAGTRHLVSALNGRRLLHLSTVQVYGTRRLVDADERCPVDPGADPYSATKAEAERIVAALPTGWLIFRPAVVWGGPHDSRLMPSLRRLSLIRSVVFPGPCRSPMPFTHVDNLADMVLAALDRPNVDREVFNVADGSLADGVSVSFRDFVLRYGERAGRPFRLVASAPVPALTAAIRAGAAVAGRVGLAWPTGLRPEVLRLFNTPCTLSVARARDRLGVIPSPREHLQ